MCVVQRRTCQIAERECLNFLDCFSAHLGAKRIERRQIQTQK